MLSWYRSLDDLQKSLTAIVVFFSAAVAVWLVRRLWGWFFTVGYNAGQSLTPQGMVDLGFKNPGWSDEAKEARRKEGK